LFFLAIVLFVLRLTASDYPQGDETIIHLAGIDVTGTAVDSSLSNVLTSGSGMNKASVSQDNFWDVVGQSPVKKNNNKDGINPLVIIRKPDNTTDLPQVTEKFIT
jgi:hypothetical protein